MASQLNVDLNKNVLQRINSFNKAYKKLRLKNTHNEAMLNLFGLQDPHIKIYLGEGKRINNDTRAIRQELILGYTYDNNYWVFNGNGARSQSRLCSYITNYISLFSEHKLVIKIFIDYPANYPFIPPQYKLYSVFNSLNNKTTLCKKLIYKMIQEFNNLDHGCGWSPATDINNDILSLLVSYINLISKINIGCLEN